jgi:hypothetical protein
VQRFRVLFVALLVAGFGFTSANASAPSLVLVPTSVRAGHAVRIHGSADGCPVGDTVFVLSRAFPRTHEFAGVPAVLAKVRAGGAFRAQTVIPRRRRPGRYGVTARCGGGNLGVSATLTVRA